MLNQYPRWKYIAIILTLLTALLYALPNIFGEDPAVQIAASARGITVDTETLQRVEKILTAHQLKWKKAALTDKGILVRFFDEDTQITGRDILGKTLGNGYAIALNLAPATPEWLLQLNAKPMYLGLDLRGGVYFLMEVDMRTAIKKTMQSFVSDIRSLLQKNKLKYLAVLTSGGNDLELRFKSEQQRASAHEIVKREFRQLTFSFKDNGRIFSLYGKLSEKELTDTKRFALEQNITTLRKRIDEKFNGLVEPIIQQQGDSRIIIQLPGIQDTAGAKDILGATATLEYRAKAKTDTEARQAAQTGRVPPGTELYQRRDGSPILLKKRVIVTGDHVTNAQAGIDPDTGGAMVSVRLDGYGGKRMGNFTKKNIGKVMAVVYIETRIETDTDEQGKVIKRKKTTKEVISDAVIRGHFTNRFQTTGLDSVQEANTLSLLLRAGALAAPVEIIEERTIGPSLGKANIDQGINSVILGFILVLIFMLYWYRSFGLIANIALGLNLVIIVAVLSILQATLTLPGIAGIVLTVGMAVDANVLIFERIREELRAGNSIQNSIHEGYAKALSTIADANVTTLIAAFVLFVVGTGPIKGFAVTLSIGIATSMFTAIVVSRAIVNIWYGNKKIETLSI